MTVLFLLARDESDVYAALSAAQFIFTPEQFGAAADGTTDDSAAIQAAIDACNENRGGEVHFRAENYKINTGLQVDYQGTVLCGRGMPGAAGANGSTRIVVAEGITGVTFNAANWHRTLGYGLRRIHFAGARVGNGVLVYNAENFICEDVQVSGFTGGTGLTIDGTTGNAQYAQLNNFCAGDNMKSLHLKGLAPNGVRMIGGYLAGAGTTPRAGSIGIHAETADTLRCFGTVIQGYGTGCYLEDGAGHELHGARFEYNNVNLRIGARARNTSVFGGSFVNSILDNHDAGSTGIKIDAGAINTFLMPTLIEGCSVPISNAGTGTMVMGMGMHSHI